MTRTLKKDRMTQISMHLPRTYVSFIDSLVARGLYPSRSEVLRSAITDLIRTTRQQVRGALNNAMNKPVQETPEEEEAHERVVVGEVDEDEYEEGGAVVMNSAKCGYEWALFSDYEIKHLANTLKLHRARCPRCGCHRLILEFTTRKRQQQETAPEATQA